MNKLFMRVSGVYQTVLILYVGLVIHSTKGGSMKNQEITVRFKIKGEDLLEQILSQKTENQPSIQELMIANQNLKVLMIISILVIVRLL